jgi:sec-independent protein translocase protein TatB
MAAEFQGQFQEAMREAEMADLKKSFDEVKEAASGFTGANLMTSLEKDVSKALDVDVLDKPVASTTETPAIEPPVTSTAPATSNIDAPELPIPETFTEADAHAAASQPLAIVQEAQAQPTPQDTAPAASDVLKDAKAS